MTQQKTTYEEKVLRAGSGMAVLVLNIVLMLAAVAGIVFSAIRLSNDGASAGMIALLVVCIFY